MIMNRDVQPLHQSQQKEQLPLTSKTKTTTYIYGALVMVVTVASHLSGDISDAL